MHAATAGQTRTMIGAKKTKTATVAEAWYSLLLLPTILLLSQQLCDAFTVTTTASLSISSRVSWTESPIVTCITAATGIHRKRQQQDLSQRSNSISNNANRKTPLLFSSFYGDFEEFENDEDDEEEEEDDDDYGDDEEDFDQRSIADFKSKMSNMFDSEGDGAAAATAATSVDDLINFARQQQSGDSKESQEWARAAKVPLEPGTVLVANPRRFCESPSGSSNNERGGSESNVNFFRMALGGGGDGGNGSSPSPSLLAKFGLTRPPPKSLGPDRQADLLPVVVIVEVDPKTGVNGVLLNRRTGYLLGDLEQPPPENEDSSNMPPILEKFCIQPLWFGGVDNISTGLDMLHLCPTVQDASQLTEDGMFWGGDPAQAQDAMDDPSLDRLYSGFDFKFFVQSTIWSTKALQKELDDQVWFPAKVSKNVLFKSRDRMGTKKAKPLWTEIMELMGDQYLDIKETFYAEGEGYADQDDDL